MVKLGCGGIFQANDLTTADDCFQKEVVVRGNDDELFVGLTLFKRFQEGVLAGRSDQLAVINEKNGGAFLGIGKFGAVDQVFDGWKTNAVFYRPNLTDEVLEVVFVGEVLADDGLIVRLDN